jgi:hypothetical protein
MMTFITLVSSPGATLPPNMRAFIGPNNQTFKKSRVPLKAISTEVPHMRGNKLWCHHPLDLSTLPTQVQSLHNHLWMAHWGGPLTIDTLDRFLLAMMVWQPCLQNQRVDLRGQI